MTFLVFAITPFVLLYVIYKVIRFLIGLVRAIREDDSFPDEPADAERKPPTRVFNVQCPHCGKAVTITGNTIMATCDYCGKDFQIDWTEEAEDEDEDDDMDNVIPLAAYYGTHKYLH